MRLQATSTDETAQQKQQKQHRKKQPRNVHETFEELLTPCNKTEARLGSAYFQLLTCPNCDAERIRASRESSLNSSWRGT